MGDKRNFAALDWVMGEIADTLREARQSLEAYVEDPKDTTRIRFCLTHIHQVHGSLQMVEFHGAALLAEEMEQTAQAIMDNTVASVPEAQEVLMRGLLQLPIYLEHIKNVKEDNPARIMPLLNDMRAVRKQSYLSETNLFSPDFSRLGDTGGARHAVLQDPAKLAQVLKKLREMYQFAAASVLRGIKVDENLEYLDKVFSRIELLAKGTPNYPMWEVSAALIEALKHDDLELTVAVRGLLRYLARELRLLGEKAPAALESKPRESLLKNLLFYVARAEENAKSPRVVAVKEKYALRSALLANSGSESAEEMLQAPDADAIRSVVVALQDELGNIKHVLDLSLQGQVSTTDLKDVLPSVKRVADTLAVLGIGDLRKQMIEQSERLERISEANSIDEKELMITAGKIIEIEHRLQAISKSAGKRNDLANVDEREVEIDNAKATVVKECAAGLLRCKDSIIEYISSQWDKQHLEHVATTLTEIRGGLQMIPLRRPAAIVDSCARFIHEKLVGGDAHPSFQSLESLADAMASVEYYLERLMEDLYEDSDAKLDIAEESVANLGYPIDLSNTRFSAEEASHDPLAEVREASEEEYDEAVEEAHAHEHEAEMAVDEETSAEAEPASYAAASNAVDTQSLLADAPTIESDIDDEIIEIFIEEAGEVLETLREYFPQWRAKESDQDALVVVRRAFHTLKGSGRMVEAFDIGELAWSVENMLNRVIDRTIRLQPHVFHFVDAVIDLVPTLVAAFEARKANPLKALTEKYEAWGHQMSEGNFPDELAHAQPRLGDAVAVVSPESAAGEQPEAAAVAPEEVEAVVTRADESEEDEDGVDRVLQEIFSQESLTHLITLDGFVRHMEAEAPFYTVPTDDLQRALHTLKGSAKMAQVWPIAEITEPLEHFTKELITFQVRVNDDILQLLRDAATYIREGVVQIEANQPVHIAQQDLFLARTQELRDLNVGHLVIPRDDSVSSKVDPRMLSLVMAEEMALLLDADALLRDWQRAGTPGPQLGDLIGELNVLEEGARQANLPTMAALCARLRDANVAALEGRLFSDDAFFELLQRGHESLLDMVDAVAAGQNVVAPSEALMEGLRALMVGAAPAEFAAAQEEASDSAWDGEIETAALPAPEDGVGELSFDTLPVANDAPETSSPAADSGEVEFSTWDEPAGEVLPSFEVNFDEEEDAAPDDHDRADDGFADVSFEADGFAAGFGEVGETELSEFVPAGDESVSFESPATEGDSGASDWAAEAFDPLGDAAETRNPDEEIQFDLPAADLGEMSPTLGELVSEVAFDAVESDGSIEFEVAESEDEIRFDLPAEESAESLPEESSLSIEDIRFDADTALMAADSEDAEVPDEAYFSAEDLAVAMHDMEADETTFNPAAEEEIAFEVEEHLAESHVEAAGADDAEEDTLSLASVGLHDAGAEQGDDDALQITDEVPSAAFGATDPTLGVADNASDSASDDNFSDSNFSESNASDNNFSESNASDNARVIPGLIDRIDTRSPDYDRDILEVFMEEADELAEGLDEAIHSWESNWSDTESVEEIKRILHTLKGGARLSGLSNLGDIVHDYETMLIEMGDDVGDVDQALFGRINRFQDQILGAVRGVRAFLDSDLEVGEIDRGQATAEAPTHHAEEVHHEPEATFEAEEEVEYDDDEEAADSLLAAKAPASESGKVLPFAPKPKAGKEFAMPKVSGGGGGGGAAVALKKAGPQEVVKVSSELLEELVNLAGETSINRSRLEQYVNDFSFALDEVDATLSRLQDQLRRLDIETEAQVLFRQEQMEAHDEFDPLEMDRYSNLQQLSRSLIESSSDLMDLKSDLVDKLKYTETLLLQQSRINTTLQEGLMRSRMVPFSRLVPRLRRIVRQVAGELGKNVSFELDNVEGEMDRSMLERMVPPFEHMLRNAVDHGIEKPEARIAAGKSETGRIVLTLSREGGDVIIRLADDGRGIDLKRVREKAIERGLMSPEAELSDYDVMQFILHAGFSTAEAVTQISGRGVGMDVVHAEIKQLGGSVTINSEWGKGTEFVVRLPFTLSVNRALMVSIGLDTYAVPLSSIEGIVRVSPFELEHYYANPDAQFEYANENYHVRYLGGLLHTGATPNLDGHVLPLPVLLVRSAEHTMALQVDGVMGSREIVVKSLGLQFSTVPGLSGATVMGDGSVVVILDPHALVRQEIARASMQLDLLRGGQEEERVEDRVKTIMVVDDSVTVRKVTTRFLEREGFEVVTAKDGMDAIRLLQENVPDLMLLDIEMPRMDGFEVARTVRGTQRWEHLPIIMITSRTGDKHREHALSLGVNNYLGKPYQEDILLEAIGEILDHKGRH